jgi:hypothetical protein
MKNDPHAYNVLGFDFKISDGFLDTLLLTLLKYLSIYFTLCTRAPLEGLLETMPIAQCDACCFLRLGLVKHYGIPRASEQRLQRSSQMGLFVLPDILHREER